MLKNRENSFTLEFIGIVRSCFTEKFGIPRQARLAPSAVATIELLDPFNREEMARGLDNYSHVWLQFLFHKAVSEGWKTTVRPPRLGGKDRLGVYATRSPHRPNHIGLSAVRLEGVRNDKNRIMIDVSGVDLLDGTPIIDLKPYIPYSDSVVDAKMGLNWEEIPEIQICFLPEAETFCREYEEQTGRKLNRLICEIIKADPRPASQRSTRSEFGMYLWEVNIRWTVDNGVYTIVNCGER